MGKIEKAKTDDLGVKVSGSARTGHKIELAQESALCRIFGTSDEMQANALLSHCLKPLKADEASDEHPGNDERIPDDELVKLLTRLTGSPASYARLEQGVMAQSECGGWQIKRNIAVSRLASAQRWAGYLVDQGKRHLIVPRIKGKVIGVSRSINYAPVEAQRAALEAWKRDVGWNDAQNAEGH